MLLCIGIAPWTAYCVKWILFDESLFENCFLFHTEMISANSFGEICFLEESYKKDAKYFYLKFEFFGSSVHVWEYAFDCSY